MKVTLYSLLGLTVLLYLGIWFVRVLIKMRQPVVFPITKQEWRAIRIHPQKSVSLPIISQQKAAVWIMALVISFFSVLALYYTLVAKQNWSIFVVFIPTLLNLTKLWNLFVVQEGGILCGGRFVPWKRIQSYQFIPIDMNHRYYGFSPELKDGYELMVHTKMSEVSCIVTTEAVKEKLIHMLDEHITVR